MSTSMLESSGMYALRTLLHSLMRASSAAAWREICFVKHTALFFLSST
jgi:hypothetical protein